MADDLRDAVEAMGEALRESVLGAECMNRRVVDDRRALRGRMIGAARASAERFVHTHLFSYRDSKFLKSTLEELTKGIETLEAQIWEAWEKNYAKPLTAISEIQRLPPDIIRHQVEGLRSRAAEHHRHQLDQLADLVDEFRKWSEGLISESIHSPTGPENREPSPGE